MDRPGFCIGWFATLGPPGKSVKCPGDVEVKKGKNFKCTAVLTNGQTFKLTFQMTDNKGTVKFVNVTKG